MANPIATLAISTMATTTTFSSDFPNEYTPYGEPEPFLDLQERGCTTNAMDQAQDTGLELDSLQIACQDIFAPEEHPLPVQSVCQGDYYVGTNRDQVNLDWNVASYPEACVTYSMETVKVVEEHDSFPSQDGEVSTSTPMHKSKRQDASDSSQRKAHRRKSTKLPKSPESELRHSKKKSAYKHVPHAEKPAHLVAKRNARERKRVHAVNLAFVNLRKSIPFENKRGKRVSKVKVLQRAISYIMNLHHMIREHDGTSHETDENAFVLTADDS
ncbi:hypothetical protein TCAL_03185, partial [Tigriopus californicus]|eukprot:TCALIF_03185-PA protein Name:"Similar to hlh-4 Helix-loop-helix protein 4 (Caenorhabditis elegans)" AED:0.32 eAED:0.32 QI:0/0.5/0/0.66/1/0.66/3/0/270